MNLVERFRRLPPELRDEAIARLARVPGALADLRFDWEGFWAREDQIVSVGELERYPLVIFTGPRGAGKTRAAVQLWLREVLAGRVRRPRLVAAKKEDIHKILIDDPDNGIMTCCPPEDRPTWLKSEGPAGVLRFRNGIEALGFSAEEREHMTGYQGDCDLMDDIAKWPTGSDAVWNTARISCRKGNRTGIVATTRRGTEVLRKLLRGDTSGMLLRRPPDLRANQWNLSGPDYFDEVAAELTDPDYAAQELNDEDINQQSPFAGLNFDEVPIRVLAAPRADFVEVVVVVDPADGKGAQHDEWGVGAAGRREDRHVVALDDASGSYDDDEGAEAALRLCDVWGATKIVVESNRGPRVQNAIRAAYYKRELEAARTGARARPMPEIIPIRAADGKRLRAGPLRGLYLQGMLHHVPGLNKLERQQREWDPDGPKRPKQDDRIDWWVHAVHYLADLSAEGGGAAEQLEGLAERVKAVQAKAEAATRAGELQRFPGLPSSDPRSTEHNRARAGLWGVGGGLSGRRLL